MSTNSPVSPTGRGKKKLAPPKASICTPELLKKILEIDDLSSIEDIEILFSTITDLNGGGLALCKACRSLTLIDTALLDISPQTLAPISSTLERLNLSQQGLTKISGVLNLPVLRELYLQENSITRIEGLNGCPRLQRVWLYGNKISRIDGLQCVGELRELWVQQVRTQKQEPGPPFPPLPKN
jgi:Leucine-rich repeat (LRR) protein